ncbi:dienelactone hydrolase [Streptomyces griseochromogenes]|uniref:Dienelactone hydrolase n=1 Tax=Streptomyces griseochromogenes TaxID=68214 RepID=A0A1B1AYD6_9ACTN|nr:prolyl oligopeptidase family serine peptidase [Streptomyces griseochromogenes]ANP51557.1 peptidase S9 [Streptomyces griseochromogenes]MBP2056047.1 dienelactone hydrolase [Streptomyces griseochromogenes]
MTSPYQVFVATLPDVCPADPSRMVFTADSGGRCEVFTWDSGARRARQVTDTPGGTAHCAIDADGYVWWFEQDATDTGRWWFQHFDGGPRLPGLPGAPAGQPRGLAVTAGGAVVAAVALGRETVLLVGRRGRAPHEVLRTSAPCRLGGFAPDGTLIALASSADDAAAVTVVTTDGRTVATLPGSGRSGPGLPEPGRTVSAVPGSHRSGTGLWCQGFSSRPGHRELLLVQDLGDCYAPATWTPEEGLRTHRWCTFDTEISARWYPRTREVLVRQDRHGRSLLYRVDLGSRARRIVPTPAGSLLDAAPRTGGAVDYLWTDTAHPPVAHATDGMALPPPGLSTVVPGRHTARWTSTAWGRLHTLLSLPERDGRVPPPAVFLVHGGPADHDRDAYDATVHSLVASGYAVVRVNYRGSTGYGPRWRRAFPAGVGHTQVEDLAAVRAELVSRGLVAGDASALWGVSWGAYLVLLALGTRPGLWQAGIAVKPVADWVTAHRATTPALRALDIRLFGGTPDEVPERYASSSPLSYAAAVTAPLLVVGATRDAKCPPGQIRTYLAALAAADVPHEAMWLDSGHDGYDGATHVAVLRRSLFFLRDRLPDPAPRAPGRPPAPAGGPRSR